MGRISRIIVGRLGGRFALSKEEPKDSLKDRLRSLKLIKLLDGRFDVFGDVYFGGLGLNSLLEIPIRIRRVTGDFNCGDNQLTTLKGAPERVDECFYCILNNLKTLEGAPKFVGGDFECYYNKLTSLEGAPKYVGGGFSCYNNNLTSLEGAPKYIGGNFECSDNPKHFTEEEVRKLIDVRGEVYCE